MADDNFPLITVNSSIARSEVVAGLAHTHTRTASWLHGVEFFEHRWAGSTPQL